LARVLWAKPTCQIAKEYGVSDKAIEKWAKKFELNKPPRGYWAKIAP
jgi:transposase-like protein